ncbi:unnamed protein product [Didymodactylos carnosus]|uniref:Uncharacterized protein n=1 Tax=Didymodactylos carnosus TaxID=1234261 RepID=A0A8S2L2E5_9BILA|nr:unnamed protein product [Didymodactylos carnosus]CAF3882461.1 unnamed protein product [Didymodactylos carnosus]
MVKHTATPDFETDIVDRYDFESLPLKLPQLKDFTLCSYYGLINYNIFEKIIKNLIYLNKLSLLCDRSDLSSYINGSRIDQMLSGITNLKEFHLRLMFPLVVSSHRSSMEESFINTTMKWNICFNFDEQHNRYSVYTLPWVTIGQTAFTLFLPNVFYDYKHDYSSVKEISVRWSSPHVTSFGDISQILTKNFPNLSMIIIDNKCKNVERSDMFSINSNLKNVKKLEINKDILYLDQLLLLTTNLQHLSINADYFHISMNDSVSTGGMRNILNNIIALDLYSVCELVRVQNILTNYFENIQSLMIEMKPLESNNEQTDDCMKLFCQTIMGMKKLYGIHFFLLQAKDLLPKMYKILVEYEDCSVETFVGQILVWK